MAFGRHQKPGRGFVFSGNKKGQPDYASDAEAATEIKRLIGTPEGGGGGGGGGGSSLELTDGTHDITGVTKITTPVADLVVGGASPNATLGLASTAVTPATYGDATHVGQFVVDAKGRITGATSVAITFPTVPVGGNPTATASDVAVNGSAATFMRSDAAPAVQKGSTSVFGLAKADGTHLTAAAGLFDFASIADQRLLANISGGSAAPGAQSLSAILDNIIGSTRGMLLRRGSSVWSALAIGASGQYLGTDGNDPLWQTAGSSGVGSSYSAQLNIGAANSSAISDAALGLVITPNVALTINALGLVLTTVSSGTYKFGIAPFNTSTLQITSAVTYAGTFTVGTGAANTHIALKFATPFSMSANTSYLIMCVRTDATSTTSMTVNFESGAKSYPGIYISGGTITAVSYKLASLAPLTSDTWTSDGSGQRSFSMLYAYT